jgi:hypothetical protein
MELMKILNIADGLLGHMTVTRLLACSDAKAGGGRSV